jgi:PTH1 family peptidyl-tRNA hydrolase
MKILVGLGNPGDKYEQNRHNVGFMAVEAIAENHSGGPWKRRFQGLAYEVDIGRERCLLLKPSTFMNESGRSVGEALRFYKISPADVIVFHDELDLEPGRVRVKFGGGHAGHNGLKSLSAHIGNDYHRVRIGIGHPGSREAVVSYVLHDFSKKDREWLEPLLHAIARGAAHLLTGQDAKFLNEVARVSRTAAEPAASARKAEPSRGLGAPQQTAASAAPPVQAAAPIAAPPVLETATAAAAATPRAPEPALATAATAPKTAAATAKPAASASEREAETSLAAKLRAWFSRR